MIDLFRPLMTPAASQAAMHALTPAPDGRLMIGQGPEVRAFESELQVAYGTERPLVALNSCTSAIHLALDLIGVGPGQAVVVTPMTCAASVTPIVKSGARILWADVDPLTGLIDPSSVGRLCEAHANVSAIITVDWGGARPNHKMIRQMAAGVPIIEDAAHLGPSVMTCQGGDYIAFSYQAIKFLTTVDGGALVTPIDQGERAKLLRWYGLDRESRADFRCAQNIAEAGWKFHMNDVNAAIGRANLPQATEAVWCQVQRGRRYDEWFTGLEAEGDRWAIPANGPKSHTWLYTLLVSDRAAFTAFMESRGIAVSPVHRRCDEHTAFQRREWPTTETRPGVDYFASRNVAIPVGWWLSEDDVDSVAGAVLGWIRGEQ